MQKITFRRVRQSDVPALRRWMAVLRSREDEVRATFEQETVRSEQIWLLEGVDGPILVYAVEADDLDQAARAYRSSTLPLDKEHQGVMAELMGPHVPAELLFELSLEP